MDGGLGQSPCHHAAASPLTVAGSPAHSQAARTRASSVSSWSAARYTLGSTRTHRPAARRRSICCLDTPAARACSLLISPAWRRSSMSTFMAHSLPTATDNPV